MKSHEIRQTFLDFFKDKQHSIVASAPIVLKDDPTLMFTNSGMNQFKDFFLGYKNPTDLRTADTQKCLRVSGKHNDLDDVGKDTYHHTMFEMLGNWSFGDYFKEDAINWAWELLTEVYKIPKENLYVTVFEGDKVDKLGKDDDAYNFWKKHIAQDRILNGNKKDNFWEMGDVGPCGPCSEIHVDIRSAEEKALISGKDLVNNDHPQVVEIWNLVFMEFLRKADGSLEKLPKQNVDTGMGFERLCMVLQKTTSNYDTDVFTPLIDKVEKASGKKYGENKDTDIAIRVVVDHLRAVAFAIADGQVPSNTGAGYVIRRILRRAISYSYRFLDLKKPFIYTLVEVLDTEMGDFFPELTKQKSIIEGVIKEEETNFLRTIQQGLSRIDQLIQNHDASQPKILDGAKVFELYDTFGFPSDLSRIVAEYSGFTIDESGFETEMQKQKERSRKATNAKSEDWIELKTNEAEDFIGYDDLTAEVTITRYRKVVNNNQTSYQLVFDHTPFYAESGGQVGDKGFIENNTAKLEILDTKKENNLIVHFVKELPSDFHQKFQATVDVTKRYKTNNNHSATHLLQEAMRAVLGTHVEQKGSQVNEFNLRFDFSHNAKVTKEELDEIEHLVNIKIQANLPLEENRNVPFKEAVAKGAMALFGEKYGNNVRTIKFGTSVELCGGTHAKNTGDLALFQITSESAIASGIRRIEAITGETARLQLKGFQVQNKAILESLKSPEDPIKSIESLLLENQKLSKQLEIFILEKAKAEKANWLHKIENTNGVNLLIVKTDLDPENVKKIAFQLRNEVINLLFVAGSTHDKKPNLTVAMSDDLVASKNWNASQIVRDLAKEINGGGGGQAFFATAGGKKLEGLGSALEKAKQLV